MRTRFAGLDISFDERVLAPRQWTEVQSRWAADLLPDLPDGDVLELCCGAGQIGLSAVAGSARRLVAVDINPVAAHYTTLNARRARVPLAMRLGPMRRMLASEERFPVILADPPWVPTGRRHFPTTRGGGHRRGSPRDGPRRPVSADHRGPPAARRRRRAAVGSQRGAGPGGGHPSRRAGDPQIPARDTGAHRAAPHRRHALDSRP